MSNPTGRVCEKFVNIEVKGHPPFQGGSDLALLEIELVAYEIIFLGSGSDFSIFTIQPSLRQIY